MAALCVGGMIVARTLPDSLLAGEMRVAARDTAEAFCGPLAAPPEVVGRA